MPAYFDIRTLSFVAGIVAITLGGCMLFVSTNQKVYPGFTKWTVGSLLNGLGMILLGLRDLLPDFLTVLIANALIVIFFVLITRGLLEFIGSEQKIWLDITPVIVLMTSFVYFNYYSPNVNARIVIISMIIALLCGRSAFILHRQVPLLFPGSNRLLLMSFSLAAIWFFLRVIFTMAFESPIQDFMSAGVVHGITFVFTSVINITIVTGLIIINARRLEYDLTTARSELKSLSGLLPICSNCKKIRDDQGYWQQLETYITEHSEADFTHGICNDCMTELYPEYAGPEA
jgi:hypothetical protein